MAKKKKSLGEAIKGAAKASQQGAEKAIAQGKGTPIRQQKQTSGRQSGQSKYQDGQYGQFIKTSRLGQSGAAQRNNAQNQQQISSRRKQQNTKAASTYGELNERVNERNQRRAKQQSKSAHRLADATKGTLQQTLGSHATTFYAARNPNEDKYIKSEEIRKQRGEKNRSKFSEGQYGQLVKKERSGNVKEREKNLAKASKMIDKGTENIEKSKKGLNEAEKFAVDTYSAMLGMATDAAAGPFSMGSMASRSFGGAYDTAKKEGANDSQAALYGASQAAVEVGTEKMFSVAKPLKKLYGGGAGDDVAEKLLEKMTKKAATKAGKELAYHGGKTGMAALSEGLEEMVSEGLEPALANAIYADATGTPHSTSAKDILYAGAVGGAMGGILGGGGQAVEYNQGRKVQKIYGDGGLKTMAKNLRDIADEATDGAAIGELTNQTIDAGQPVTSVQARRLYQAAAQQEEADYRRQSAMNTVASNEITKNNYLNPVERDADGNTLVGENTRRRYDESVQNTVQQIKESGMDKGMGMPDSQVEQIASAVSAIQTGVAGTNEVNMFLAANPKARTVYETVTGEKLPASNTDTKETLYGVIAAKRVESAKLETEAFADRVKGGMVQDVAKTYEPSGQAAFEQMMDQVDVTNAAQTQNDITAFDDYYRAGRNGIAYETVARMNNPAHQASSSPVRQAAWEAGASDAVLAADTAKGVQMEIGKKISQSRLNGKSGARKGKVISELSQGAKRNLPASQQRMFRQLSRAFGINIHIVDEAGFNGKYEDGEVYLSVQADRELPYVFSHEITHHMQEYAPVEYNDLKELVRQVWAEKGGIDEAVNDKIAQYAEKGVQLNYEDALDEIIADSTYEMIQDEGFAEQLCSGNRSFAQKLLDAIKNVLSKLRQVLAEGDGFTPAQNAALLSQLDILKDAEELWTDGLAKAAENRDAVGTKESDKESYSLRQFEDGQRYVEIDVDTSMFDELTKKEKGSLATKIIKKRFAGKPVGTENRIFVNGKGAEEYGFPLVRLGETEHDAKMRSSVELDNLFDAGTNFRKLPDGADGHVHPDVVDGFSYFDVLFKVGDRYFKGVINIKNTKKGQLFKDITKIKDVTEDTLSSYGENPKSQFLRTSSNNSISQTSKKDNEKFSLKEPVEERGNLVALHNISADNLLSTLKLGGFPMPSIAITKTDIGHTNFGDISLIFDKDTIDPEKSDNKVYAADAWTPTFPTVEYELDDSKAYKRANDVGSLTFFNPVTLNEANLKSAIGGQSLKSAEEQLVDRFKNDYGLKNMYLAETSEPVKMVKAEKEKYSPERVEELKKYIDELGIDAIKKIRKEHDTSSEDFARAKKICEEINGKEMKTLIVNMDLFAALEYSRDGSTEVVDDEAATKKLIDEKVDQKTYEEWLHELFDGIVKNEGIWNGEDPYTQSGDLKDFNRIHMPITADNIVMAMLGQADDVRNSSNMFLGTRTVRAVAAEEFKSIEGIRKASGKLKNIDTEEYDSVKEALDDRLNDIMHEISDGTRKSDNEFMDMDTLGRGIEEGCRKPTPENFKKVLKDYGWKINDAQAQELADVANDIADMPVNMFEAKPQRVVGIDEIKTAVIPSDANESVRTALDDAGIETAEYEAGNDEDRILKVNEAAEQKNVKFSLKDSDGRELSKAQQEYFKDSKVRDEDGNLLVMYHGTPKGDFTVFRDGSYFTQNKRYADGYQNETAGRTELDPKTYEVYLNITKPFDIRNDEEARNIYINDYIKGGNAVGINPYMSDAEYDKIDTIDWTEGDDLKDFLIDEEYDYDGLVLDEGADGGYGEDVVYRGDSYVIFSSDQVKNVDNENPTSDPDIRYSFPEEPLYRFSNSKNPMSEMGHAMFADSEGNVEHYGENRYVVDASKLTPFDDVKPLIEKAYDEAAADDFDPMKNFDIDEYSYQDKEAFVDSFDPEDIIDNADGYDNPGMNAWFYEYILEPNGIAGIRTQNGGVVYDESLIQNAGKRHYSFPDEESIMDYAADHETEFVDVPPVRDYERKARSAKMQTVGELRAQVDKLKADKKLTRGRILNKKSVKEQVNDMVVMLKSYGTVDGKKTDTKLVNQATDNIASIYRYIKEGDYPGAVNQAYNAAQDMVDNLHLVDDSMFREYEELRDLMRTTKISISEEDAANIPDFREWKKSQFGRLRIGNDGMDVDTFYQVLTEKYPELFDSSISHPADQLQAMADVRESMEPFDILLDSEERSDIVEQAAHDMIDIAATGTPWKSWADRKKESYDLQVKRLKQRQKEALRDVREKSKESREKAVQKVRAKKDEQIKAVRQRGKEKLETEKKKQKKKEQKRKAQAERRKRFERIEKNHKWLSDRLLKPTDDKHIPEEFKTAVAHLLSQIDLQTERSKNLEAKYGKTKKKIQMDDFRRRYAELAREDGTGMFEYDGYIFQLIDSLADKMNGRSIDECSDVEIAEFDTLLKAIRHNIQNYNKAFSDSLNENISDMAEETINKSEKLMGKMKGGKHFDRSGAAGAMDSMLNESMVTPRDFFERLGGGMNKVFGSLRKGFDQHVDNITNAREFFGGIFKPYNRKGKPGSRIEKWRDASQSKEFDVYGGKITLNPAQIMSLYCLSKRDQAMGHILGGGIVASRVDAASKIKQAIGAKIETRGSSVMVTMEDIARITASLTPEQRAMADKMQDYLNNECAEWGNKTSMRLYGYRKFTEENYFPIKSADTYLDSNIEGRNSEERIRNFGFTKGTVVNANNPIMIDDIFRVTADHINKMSLYNAFAAPISDFMRVYNFKARNENGQLVTSVKAGLEDAYGKKALNYINNFMSDVNNQVQTRTEGFGRFVNKSLANYKKATIGFNARVALQQPTAIMRAFILMNPKYFVNGSVNVKKNLADMKAHCQTARWKSWGFSQVDMARDIDQIMMNNEWSRMDVLTMKLYGALDNVTWSYIWAAVKKETKAKHPEVEVGSDEFYQICNDRAAEVFDKTQVVDSVFHRSQVMRNTDTMSKMLTSFMAEPTRTFNMMRTEFAMAKDLWNEGQKGKAVAKMNRACSVFMLNAAAVSAAAAVADALRGRTPDDDDKDDDSFFTNFIYNLWDNVNPANMIPVAKDIWGAKDGWSIKNMALSGYESLVQAAQDFAKDPSAENARSLAEGFGLVTGLPIKNIMREFGIFGIDVFAAEGGDTGLYDRKEDSLLDKVLNSLGLGKTEQQKKERDYEKEVKSVEKAADGLTGSERQEAIWKAATEKYSTYIEDGDMSKIYEMRKVLEATGGDVDKFDKSVQSKVVTAYKKNIGEDGNGAARGALREYLLANGYTEAKISQEIVAKSDTAKEFQKAACAGDENKMYLEMFHLFNAGVQENDIQALYANRTKSIKAGDYSTGEFSAPVNGRISSGFGYRNSPGGIGSTNHKGIDIAVPLNSDVAAADGGKVVSATWSGGYGYMVTIDHGNGRRTQYAHLNGYYVQKGDSVSKGQIIAKSGSTGNSTGPHLHFEVRENGTPVNPMNYLK